MRCRPIRRHCQLGFRLFNQGSNPTNVGKSASGNIPLTVAVVCHQPRPSRRLPHNPHATVPRTYQACTSCSGLRQGALSPALRDPKTTPRKPFASPIFKPLFASCGHPLPHNFSRFFLMMPFPVVFETLAFGVFRPASPVFWLEGESALRRQR